MVAAALGDMFGPQKRLKTAEWLVANPLRGWSLQLAEPLCKRQLR